MPYRVLFFDASANVLSDTSVEWWSETNVFEPLPKDWPPHAVRLRVLDPDGVDFLRVAKYETSD